MTRLERAKDRERRAYKKAWAAVALVKRARRKAATAWRKAGEATDRRQAEEDK